MNLSRRGWSGRARCLLATLLLVALTLAPVQVAAQTQALDIVTALQALTRYGLVQGDTSGDLMLAQPITRAQLMTIAVRALGQEDAAVFLATARPFPDLDGHWAAGYVQVAKNLGLARGYEDGTFRPDQPVTYAETMAILLRLVGKEPTTGTWPDSVVLAAVQAGIAPAGVELARMANEPAVRLDVFGSLYQTVTGHPDPATGKTLLQQIDVEPPAVNLAALPSETTATRITVSGNVSADVASVTVNGSPVAVRNGSFGASVDLESGNNTITVVATDFAGNQTTATAAVARRLPVAKIEISGPNTVQVGGTATYTIKVLNSTGDAVDVAGGLTATVSGGIGSFDVKTGVLTAAGEPGSGTITVSYAGISASAAVTVVDAAVAPASLEILSANAVQINASHQVRVRVLDGDGNPVTTDSGRAVTLVASDLAGVTVSPATATTVGGIATFTVRGTQTGVATLTATSAGLTPATQALIFSTGVVVRLSATPSQVDLATGGTVLVRAHLEDLDGQAVTNNTGSDIRIRLTLSGATATASSDELRIAQGRSTSTGYDATVTPQGEGTLRLRGTILSGHDYVVNEASVAVRAPGTGQAYEIRVLPPGDLDAGQEGVFVIQVLDRSGNFVQAGSFAYRLKIDTSNNDPKTDGIPDGVTIRFGDFDPDDLNPTETAVRTDNGSSLLFLSYDKSGKVTVTPVGASGGTSISDDDGEEATASSSTGLKMTAATVNVKKPLAAVELRVKSPVSSEWSVDGGVLRTSSSQEVILQARALDGVGEDAKVIPGYSESVTLSQTGSATDVLDNMTQKFEDGIAEWRVRADGANAGEDWFQVTTDGHTSNPVRVAAQDASAKEIDQPIITAINGLPDGGPNRLNANDEHLRIELGEQGAGLVAVRVYRGTSLAWTSPVIDISSAGPYVDVPRSQLPNSGTYKFSVQLVNAQGTSDKSAASEDVKLIGFNNSISITRAYIVGADNAADRKLIIVGRSFDTDGEVDGSKLTLVDPNGEPISLQGATVSGAITSTQLTLALENAANVNDAIAANEFTAKLNGGDVYLKAEAGWFIMDGGEGAMAGDDLSGNPVTPMGHITSAEVDLSGGKLYIYGDGLKTGTLNATKFTLDGDGGGSVTLSAPSSVTSSQTQLVLTLTGGNKASIADEIYGEMTLTAAPAWLTDSSGKNVQVQAPAYVRVRISSISYDGAKLILNGSGFDTDGRIDVSKLTIKDTGTDETLDLDDLGGATAQIQSSAKVEITLHANQIAAYEDDDDFNGFDIYLIAGDGWYEDSQDRTARPITAEDKVRVPQP